MIQRQIVGAFVSALVALPLGLAFGVASGLGAEAGVLGAVIAGSISALLGGTAGQHSGPTGAVAVLLALSVAHFAVFFPNQPEIVVALTLFVVVLSGAIQVLFGLMKWGRVVELLPHSVVSGLLTAIGLMLILEQLPAVLGGENWVRPLEVIMALPTMLHSPVWSELILGLLAGSLMFFWPKYLSAANRWLPAPILVLVLGVFLNWLFATPSMQAMVGLWWGDVRVIGPLNFSMPTLQLPPIEVWQLPYLVQTAFTLAVVGSLVSLLGAVVTEKLTRQMHNPDKELIGQGLGNMASGLLGGMASTGAPMRTLVAMSYGSRDAWSAAVHALLVGVLALVASDFFAAVPLSVLGGMLIKVGLDQIDWSYLKRWKTTPKAGRVMMLAVLITALLLDLVTAVVVGLAIASVVLLGRMTQLQLNALHIGYEPDAIPCVWFSAEEKYVFEQAKKDTLVFIYLDVPMSFGAARAMSRRVLAMQGRAFIFDFRAVPYIDFSSAMVLEDIIYRLQQRGAKVWLLLALGETQTQLERQAVLAAVAQNVLFERQAALKQALNWLALTGEQTTDVVIQG